MIRAFAFDRHFITLVCCTGVSLGYMWSLVSPGLSLLTKSYGRSKIFRFSFRTCWYVFSSRRYFLSGCSLGTLPGRATTDISPAYYEQRDKSNMPPASRGKGMGSSQSSGAVMGHKGTVIGNIGRGRGATGAHASTGTLCRSASSTQSMLLVMLGLLVMGTLWLTSRAQIRGGKKF